ncbi:uncharacterized protein LOC111022120 [Momordica charantia]|uniref:Uncharacterized protein LOC111022120 n=1 Tax=Momordica charantia TaxID=3673 RepID=A0A6J1DL50_MOMCH|nr:uncharacterized protein LOC111022120 [Momordica charantia]
MVGLLSWQHYKNIVVWRRKLGTKQIFVARKAMKLFIVAKQATKRNSSLEKRQKKLSSPTATRSDAECKGVTKFQFRRPILSSQRKEGCVLALGDEIVFVAPFQNPKPFFLPHFSFLLLSFLSGFLLYFQSPSPLMTYCRCFFHYFADFVLSSLRRSNEKLPRSLWVEFKSRDNVFR